MFDRAPSGAMFETLESRQFLSVASEIDLVDAPVFQMMSTRAHGGSMMATRGYDGSGHTRGTTIPNIRRTYTGSFVLGNLNGTFKLVVRKEDLRGTYAALRGTLDINTNLYGNIHGDMTYGKIRDNLRINMTLTSVTPPLTMTITGKSSTSGSQLKGQLVVTGSANFTTLFTLNKFVAP